MSTTRAFSFSSSTRASNPSSTFESRMFAPRPSEPKASAAEVAACKVSQEQRRDAARALTCGLFAVSAYSESGEQWHDRRLLGVFDTLRAAQECVETQHAAARAAEAAADDALASGGVVVDLRTPGVVVDFKDSIVDANEMVFVEWVTYGALGSAVEVCRPFDPYYSKPLPREAALGMWHYTRPTPLDDALALQRKAEADASAATRGHQEIVEMVLRMTQEEAAPYADLVVDAAAHAAEAQTKVAAAAAQVAIAGAAGQKRPAASDDADSDGVVAPRSPKKAATAEACQQAA